MFGKLWRRAQRERELDDEIRFHLEQEARLRRDAGATAEQADLAARREFGSVTLVKEVTRAMRSWTSIERILQDFRVARRGLARGPGWSCATSERQRSIVRTVECVATTASRGWPRTGPPRRARRREP